MNQLHLLDLHKSIIQYNFQYTELFSILNTLWSQSGRYTEVLLYRKTSGNMRI